MEINCLDNDYRKYSSRSQKSFAFHAQLNAVSGAGEPPPCALSDTDVNLSAHPAPIIQPSVLCLTANAE
ncbi:MAG: hypothetical protein ABSB22_26995, partial [Thermodesulfobacteriota bacterium]